MRREDGWMAGRQKTFNLPRNATGKQQGAHKSPHHLPRLDTLAPCSRFSTTLGMSPVL